jgi:hypothetical protein
METIIFNAFNTGIIGIIVFVAFVAITLTVKLNGRQDWVGDDHHEVHYPATGGLEKKIKFKVVPDTDQDELLAFADATDTCEKLGGEFWYPKEGEAEYNAVMSRILTFANEANEMYRVWLNFQVDGRCPGNILVSCFFT